MKTLKEIHEIREAKRKELDLRINTKADTREKHILVCHGTGCTSSKSPEILENFRRILEAKRIDLPVTYEKAKEDILPNIKEYLLAEDGDTQVFYESPFLETQALINETTSLIYEKKVQTGVTVIKERGNNRKDRYTSISYGNYFVTQLEKDLLDNIEEYEVGVFVN